MECACGEGAHEVQFVVLEWKSFSTSGAAGLRQHICYHDSSHSLPIGRAIFGQALMLFEANGRLEILTATNSSNTYTADTLIEMQALHSFTCLRTLLLPLRIVDFLRDAVNLLDAWLLPVDWLD